MVDRNFDHYYQNPDGSITKTTYEQDRAIRSENISRERLCRDYPQIDQAMPDEAQRPPKGERGESE
jgi:hypothetical protein